MAICVAVSVLSACGGSASVPDAAPVTAAKASSPLPAVEVHDLAHGGLVQLRDLLPAAKPLLLWFWAPH